MALVESQFGPLLHGIFKNITEDKRTGHGRRKKKRRAHQGSLPKGKRVNGFGRRRWPPRRTVDP